MRVVVLGCGYHGRGIAYEIAAARDVSALVVADRDGARAKTVAERTEAEWAALDVRDGAALGRLIEGAALVVNATGPYHLTALPVIDAAMARRVRYADMCDDHEVAEALFWSPEWDARAKESGVGVLVGCGIAPGVSALLARLGCERLERAERVSIRFAWNYSIEYPAALHHFLRINGGLAPQYMNGVHVRPGAFAGRETVGFLDPVGAREVFYTGIIDPVTLPASVAGLAEVTAKGAFLQPEANAFLEAMVRWGMTSYDEVPGTGLSPFALLAARLGTRPRELDIPPLPLPMAVRVEVEGRTRGARARVRFECHEHGRRASTSATVRAALALARGELAFTGVRAPEGAIAPVPFLKGLAELPDIKLYELDDSGAASPLVP